MKSSRACALLLILSIGAISVQEAHAGADKASSLLPRFASLKRSLANIRVGPGTRYPIRWIYRKRALPVEIMAEFGNWRRVRGSDGSDGWVHSALLSANRTALLSPWSTNSIDLRSRPTKEASVTARLEPRVLVDLYWCDRTWCSVGVRGRELHGYVRQIKLWGVYPDEIIASRSIWRPFESLLGG